jgi:chromate transporter
MENQTNPTLSYKDIFLVFLRSGMAFGGGTGIVAALEDELVRKKQVLTREAFLEKYALGRITPAGTSASLAVAFGYRFGGLAGTVVALTALLLPGVTLTVLLTMGFSALHGSPVLAMLAATLVPAAMAFIVLAALKFGKEVFRPSLDLVVAAGACAGVLVFGLHPVVLLAAGGVVGLVAFRHGEDRA